MQVQHLRAPEQALEDTSHPNIEGTSKSPVGDISVVTLIRTDTTLDHSQKAEKVWKPHWRCATHGKNVTINVAEKSSNLHPATQPSQWKAAARGGMLFRCYKLKAGGLHRRASASRCKGFWGCILQARGSHCGALASRCNGCSGHISMAIGLCRQALALHCKGFEIGWQWPQQA